VLLVGLFLVVWPVLDSMPFPGSSQQFFFELWIPGIPLTWAGLWLLRRGRNEERRRRRGRPGFADA